MIAFCMGRNARLWILKEKLPKISFVDLYNFFYLVLDQADFSALILATLANYPIVSGPDNIL